MYKGEINTWKLKIKTDKQELKRKGQLENDLLNDDGAFISGHLTELITVICLISMQD